MSPLAPAGTRGYPDGQRVGNWDSPLLFQEDAVNHNGVFQPPVLDVSRYAYLGGFDQPALLPIEATFIWSADGAGTVVLGGRDFTLSEQIPRAAQYRLPNMGPFCQITYHPLGGANWQHSAHIIGTNRVHPLEFIPENALLIDQQTVVLAAGATTTLYPGDYYAGPVTVWYNAGGATGQIWAEYLTTAGTWHQINQLAATAAGNNTLTWTMPAGAWRFNVKNTTAAAVNYFLAVTPSTTGAI